MISRSLNGSDSYEIGKFYRVPCLKARTRLTDGFPIYYWHGEWIPIIGPLHRDAEIIDFPFAHWHIDWRFVSAKVYEDVQGSRYDKSVLSMPFQQYPISARVEDTTQTMYTGNVELRRLKCKRPMPSWEPIREHVKWLAKLEESCAHLKMKNMVCPHRGIPLKSCSQDGDVVMCPGHGLRWNVKTGELVR